MTISVIIPMLDGAARIGDRLRELEQKAIAAVEVGASGSEPAARGTS